MRSAALNTTSAQSGYLSIVHKPAYYLERSISDRCVWVCRDGTRNTHTRNPHTMGRGNDPHNIRFTLEAFHFVLFFYFLSIEFQYRHTLRLRPSVRPTLCCTCLSLIVDSIKILEPDHWCQMFFLYFYFEKDRKEYNFRYSFADTNNHRRFTCIYTYLYEGKWRTHQHIR